MVRNKLWKFLRSTAPENKLLPWWLMLARLTLFPLDTIYWKMSSVRGYLPESDTWLINGVTYSNEELLRLASAHGELYRATRTGNTVTLCLVKE